MTRRCAGVALAGVIGLAAGCASEVSPTGYVGTWVRGDAERAQSRLSIFKDGEAYRVRWDLSSADGRWKVACDWDGPCVESRDGEPVAEFRFTARVDEQSGRLVVECNGRNLVDQARSIHWIDEFAVDKTGKKLTAWTLVQGEQRFEGRKRPKRRFTKLSNEVPDAPRGG